ncbi:FecR family protein [Mesonia sp. MT50]|uniref:FecR family protein n=1 Tax=Mesonia profundi TaxID=3070998 RepID=A0ABU0ZZ76_9FLAO|nr:FecR family protein [Mesonia profundi]MDQ7916033.1 FecR family protein [Mesonia profundi]
MKEEEIIKKWLDNETLSTEEIQFLQGIEGFDDYKKIAEKAAHFKAPEVDITEGLENLKKEKQEKKTKNIWLSRFPRIAAILVIAIGSYFLFFHSNYTDIDTLAKVTKQVSLPDHSEVVLNANSSISYSKDNWTGNREIHLAGEAFFKVAKGKKFTVITNLGEVTVLGTQFNVRQREESIQVDCYEGLVEVKINNETIKLSAGKSLAFRDQQLNQYENFDNSSSWLRGKSTFKSIPLREVFKEFERQYAVKIQTKNLTLDQEKLFTGSFTHKDIETAIKSVTLPFGLDYSIQKDEIIVSARE